MHPRTRRPMSRSGIMRGALPPALALASAVAVLSPAQSLAATSSTRPEMGWPSAATATVAPTSATPAPGPVPTEVAGLDTSLTASESQPDRQNAVAAAVGRHHRVLDEGDSDNSHNLFAEPDGSLSLVSYQGTAFVKRDGHRIRTSPRVEPVAGTSRLSEPDLHYPLTFDSNKSSAVGWALPGGTVSVGVASKLSSLQAPTAAADGTVNFGAAFSHATLAVTPLASGFDTDVVLADAKAPTTYSFTLSDPSNALGGVGHADQDGGWVFPGTVGAEVRIGRVTATASNDNPANPADTASASLAVAQTAGGYILTESINPNWMQGKSFPIDLDPYFTVTGSGASGGTQTCDAVASGTYAATNYCVTNPNRLLVAGNVGYTARSLLRPDISSIPSHRPVTLASLHVVTSGTRSPANQQLQVCRSTQYNGGTSYTWNSTAGGSPVDCGAAFWTYGTEYAVDIDITSIVQGWVNGTANQGLVLKEANETLAQYTQLYDSNNADSRGWPSVTVAYVNPPNPAVMTAATPHNGAMTVSWNQSSDLTATQYNVDVFDVNGTFQGYAVTSGTSPVPGNQTSVTFNHAYNPNNGAMYYLYNGWTDTYRVNAGNSAGFGGYAAGSAGSITATVQGVPGAVTSLAVGGINAPADATWSAGAMNGGTLQNYLIMLYPYQAGATYYWPASNVTAYCVQSSPLVTFTPLPAGCYGSSPTPGQQYVVEVFEQNYSGDTYSGSNTNNTATGAGYGPPVWSSPVLVTSSRQVTEEEVDGLGNPLTLPAPPSDYWSAVLPAQYVVDELLAVPDQVATAAEATPLNPAPAATAGPWTDDQIQATAETLDQEQAAASPAPGGGTPYDVTACRQKYGNNDGEFSSDTWHHCRVTHSQTSNKDCKGFGARQSCVGIGYVRKRDTAISVGYRGDRYVSQTDYLDQWSQSGDISGISLRIGGYCTAPSGFSACTPAQNGQIKTLTQWMADGDTTVTTILNQPSVTSTYRDRIDVASFGTEFETSTDNFFTSSKTDRGNGRFRCDSASYLYGRMACVFDDVKAVFKLSRGATSGVSESANLILQASKPYGNDTRPDNTTKFVPGFEGRDPLTRTYYDTAARTAHRTAANKVCVQFWGANYASGGKSCDEYPFASTAQGATDGSTYWAAGVISAADNSLAGSRLNTFYQNYRVVDTYQPFYVRITE